MSPRVRVSEESTRTSRRMDSETREIGLADVSRKLTSGGLVKKRAGKRFVVGLTRKFFDLV